MMKAPQRIGCVAALLTLVAFGAPPERASGQGVVGTVRDAGSAAPLQGVLVSILNPDGERLRGVLTDDRGRFAVEIPLGRYQLQAERIGLRTVTTDPFDLNTFNMLERHIDMAERAVEIAGLVVDGRVQSCRIDPEEGVRIQRWWQEIRTALDVSAALQREQFAAFQVERFEREWDDGLRRPLARNSGAELSLSTRPFVSAGAGFLSEGGFVQGSTTGQREYYGPDADVLLSDLFLSEHCFSLVEGDDRRDNLGLRFEPGGARDVVDIEGTLWVDTTTAELQRLDFRYAEANDLSGEAGGMIDFDYLESGAWIVSEWYIRMPMFGATGRPAEPFQLVGYHDIGGRVSPLPETEIDDGGGVGAIRGLVYDRTHERGLADATVTIIGSTEHTATSDPAGEFILTNVPVGRHNLTFFHEDLDAWGLGSPFASVRVRESRTSDARLDVPDFRPLALSLCLGEGLGAETIVMGHVLGPDREGIVGAPVELESTHPEHGGVTLVLRTSREGRFVACSLPGESTVTMRARVGNRWIEAFTLPVPTGRVTYREVWVTR